MLISLFKVTPFIQCRGPISLFSVYAVQASNVAFYTAIGFVTLGPLQGLHHA